MVFYPGYRQRLAFDARRAAATWIVMQVPVDAREVAESVLDSG
jgi:hypothetical protein